MKAIYKQGDFNPMLADVVSAINTLQTNLAKLTEESDSKYKEYLSKSKWYRYWNNCYDRTYWKRIALKEQIRNLTKLQQKLQIAADSCAFITVLEDFELEFLSKIKSELQGETNA